MRRAFLPAPLPRPATPHAQSLTAYIASLRQASADVLAQGEWLREASAEARRVWHERFSSG